MNVKGKTKDTIKSRHNLEEMGLRPTLHPIKEGDKWKMPPAPFTFSSTEKHTFCNFLKDLKVPDGFSSNISYCVNSKEARISGLKSHDYHVILEHLLPLAMCGLLTPLVREALTEMSRYFTILCAKVINVEELKQLDSQIPITLCKLEKLFPLSFFDVMMHLPVHLASEARVGGPVQFRWMYPIEQYMYKLKSYIRNRARPEASIAEGYLVDDCMTLCSRYMQNIETRFNRLEQNYDFYLFDFFFCNIYAETIQKHAEIQETMEKDKSLSYVQVSQKVFKSKSRDPVVGLGGGITLKDMNGPQPSREVLQTELNAAKIQNEALTNQVELIQEENTELKSRMGLFEAEMKMFKDTLLKQFNVSLTNNVTDTQTPST